MEFSRPEYWRGLPFPSPGHVPKPGIEPRSPTLQVASLPSEPPGKPKNTRVGSLSLLQGIFLTQESNRGLLHCRWILYQLSYEGSPGCLLVKSNFFLFWVYIPLPQWFCSHWNLALICSCFMAFKAEFFKSIGLESRKPGFKSWHCHGLVVRP